MKLDKNNRKITAGDHVRAPHPTEDKTFLGYVKWFTGKFITVIDFNDELHKIEPQHVEVLPEQY